MKLSELRIGGIFYRKDEDGFRACCIHQEELDKKPEIIKLLTQQFGAEGRLFVRASKPFNHF